MKILIVGSGGREHALCWRIARSPLVTELYCAPGNPGTAQCATNIPIAADELDRLTDFAVEREIELTVVGPEVPLCQGIKDKFSRAGLLLAGPTAAAARLEGSKAFAKAFLRRHEIPTAPFGVFEEPEPAFAYIDANPRALVVKADGLAAGKGVFICGTGEEAKEAVSRLLQGSLGDAGRQVLVEERLEGEEASFIVITDGRRLWPFAGSQDHKRVHDGDRGPNTGGMGAYCPAPIIDDDLQQRIIDQIMTPTIQGMAAEGNLFQGILYAGLMIDGGVPQVLEFNCRFGDPETQPLMMGLESDLVPYLLGSARGELPPQAPRWSPKTALCVILAAEGYPGSYRTGLPISGLEEVASAEEIAIFHSGTATRDDSLVTAGGRVLGVTALGKDPRHAQELAYAAAGRIHWPGMHYRKDIGHRALGVPRKPQ